MKLAAILSITIVIVYILFQSLHPAYYMHLYPDVFAFHDRALYFWENGSLTNLGHNEYQPGAIIFFTLLSPVFLIDQTVEGFKWALFGANIVFILLITFLLMKMRKTTGVFLLSLILIFLGPILLFRFDLLVIFLTILSFYFWAKNKHTFALLILAFAIITKVYPLIFLPYLFFQRFKAGKKLEAFYLFFTFSAVFFLYLLAYTYFFQISLSDTWVSYNFHNLKSVATESVWASGIYFYSLITGQPLPNMESAYGINAIARTEVTPSIQFYNYFWIIPLGVLYIVYFIKNKHWQNIDYQFLNLLLVTFLIFYKVLCNQYWGWFLFMLPLIEMKTLLRKNWIISLFLIFLTTILHTFVYPLNYSDWLAVFTEKKVNLLLLWVMIISSLILPVIAIRIGLDVFKVKK